MDSGHVYLDGTLLDLLKSGPKRQAALLNWDRKRGLDEKSTLGILSSLCAAGHAESFRAFDGYTQYRLVRRG